ncbi:MAG TPA: bifunctional phosphopantothenoylcysteine decarboxylase/phosphopantothenate--cysteine ligase CoaBC [Acidimicrobiales bacterium]|jgi:phosphopantothenoylcysteine decarboxylase/phosphopantothenate--cysteine ligase|nr:bifunctional phosphopantothenoylcysteine decarboxylase/phosphopantothenate--cysteine ligase CoaBC [Acidimicrobiales bacterium]HJM28870.1 bifunctional phosphopantothenoylcysteine decarboxylase/phosphopantothenate--cysteine ligase CoaBC [Acidimicrobiales bacterium]HJM97894.1 bifunctional phosphopantothenoylcysteine decarboxylase/phosphopantothenate--cysteine ligase CoaBC [Acidimicrobiales bacterium]
MFSGKRVVLGVTGGIAAYKAVEISRRLVDAGAHVSPIMTNAAKKFLGEVTLSALASEPVQSSLWDEQNPIPHTNLGQQADLLLIVPATANLIGTYAAGISNDLLTSTLLATRAPVLICPAMHTEMWEHPAVQENLETLRRRGVRVVEPEDGILAGGDIGKGRLAGVEKILVEAETALTKNDLAGVRFLITAGGTREPIDPVRYISNRSSGKQGYALAKAAKIRGADVTLVTTMDRPTPSGINVLCSETAEEMQTVVMAEHMNNDVVIMAAAVADFRPAEISDHKIKKNDDMDTINLETTHDFLIDLGARKNSKQILVGFAAETENLEENALGKLRKKKLDLIVANDVSLPEVGFAHDTNEVTIISENSKWTLPLSEKRVIADGILDAIIEIHQEQTEKDAS